MFSEILFQWEVFPNSEVSIICLKCSVVVCLCVSHGEHFSRVTCVTSGTDTALCWAESDPRLDFKSFIFNRSSKCCLLWTSPTHPDNWGSSVAQRERDFPLDVWDYRVCGSYKQHIVSFKDAADIWPLYFCCSKQESDVCSCVDLEWRQDMFRTFNRQLEATTWVQNCSQVFHYHTTSFSTFKVRTHTHTCMLACVRDWISVCV